MNSADTRLDDDVDGVLQRTRGDFVAGFPATCAAMAQLIDDLRNDASDARRQELVALLHRMGGLAGTIGFPTVGSRARDLEDLVRDTTSDRLDRSLAHQALDAMRLAFEQERGE